MDAHLTQHTGRHPGKRPYHHQLWRAGGLSPSMCVWREEEARVSAVPGGLHQERLPHQAQEDTHRQRPYGCSDCGTAFNDPCALRSQARTHRKEKPFDCSQCGHTFRTLLALKIHTRVHTGERPYKCDECGKAYSRSCHLIAHKRTHTGEQPCECQGCGKALQLPSHLKEHVRNHTGEKPYECTQSAGSPLEV
ncbi:Zinc finger protein 317 [Sciurus carolinensis]|uniref:Zinc finger protein 317 n=1 Tax=Sciurus carolinensis TaxID=30640 RepID=A0AA41STU0_SCICA|nr:Zinc finger protein 317 [Sciurus carolinensis]